MGWHMSRPAEAAIDAWYEAVNGRGEAPDDTTQTQVRGDILYSYGSHFELARPLRNKKGAITGYLLNGDTYSNITSQHQAHVRHVLRDEETVIIPHEALNNAGIDLGTVQIIHVKPDTWTTTHHRTTEMPPGARWHSRPIHERRPKSDAEIGAMLTKLHKEAFETRAMYRRWHAKAAAENPDKPNIWQKYVDAPPPVRFSRHKLSEWTLTETYIAGYDRRLYTRHGGHGEEITVTEEPDGTTVYTWTTTRHWLGEALIRARITWHTDETCPECGGFYRHPKVGDEWDVRCMRCSRGWRGRAGTILKAHHRWSYYLSGFDHEEARPLYFFAELPRGSKPATVAEAYEALKPDPVRLAEQMGRPIFRQGDIFGVPTRLDRKALKALGARIEKRRPAVLELSPVMREVQAANLPYVLKTNHTATEVAYLPSGVTLARGTMYHDPDGRDADHARRRIGDGKSWHVVVKNTVPISVRR